MLDIRRERILRSVLEKFVHGIERVSLFGSHATGKARSNSDIDLVIYGSLSDVEIDRLWTLFDDSDLAVKVDVIAYRDDLYPPLKRHIDLVAKPLFNRADLTEATAPRAAYKDATSHSLRPAAPPPVR